MAIPRISFDKSFFVAQLTRLNRLSERDVNSISETLVKQATLQYERLKNNPINPEYLICPDIFYGIYTDTLKLIGTPQKNEKVLEVGIGTGGHLMFYPEDIVERIVGLEKGLPALRVLTENNPEITEVLPIEMNELDSVTCSPLYACIGANTLYYANGFTDLRNTLQAIDRKLTGTNASGKKVIVHVFSLQPENSSAWGGKDFSRISATSEEILDNYESFFCNFKKAAFEILDGLGYSATFDTKSRFRITPADRVNHYQQNLLEQGKNAYIIEKGTFTHRSLERFNDIKINPGEFLQLVTYDFMAASKK